MMKKLLSSLLAVLLILGCCTVALAAETGTGLDVKLLNSTADQVTLGVYVAQETAMKNSRVVLEYPEAMTLENAVSKLPQEAGITDLRTSEPGKVSFAWASYEAQNGAELFEVTLRIQDTEQPALPLTISLPEQGRSETLLITIPYTFRDVADDTVWYYPYVYAAYYAGLMNGVGDDLFDPNGTLTRGAMATLLYRMAGTPQVTGSSPFSDVASGRYYTDAVIWAAQNQLVNGYGNGTFGPANPVTREQAATMMIRFADFTGIELETVQSAISFADADQISNYAKDAVKRCVMAGIVNGYKEDGTFRPQNAIRRCEAAKMIVCLAQALGNGSAPVLPTDPSRPTDPTQPVVPTDPTQPVVDPGDPVTITFSGEHGYVKYDGKRVTEIQTTTGVDYVEFGIYGVWDDGYELDQVTASNGKLNRAGDRIILSDFTQDVEIHFTTRFRSVRIDYVISPNYQGNLLTTPQYVTWGSIMSPPTHNRVGYHVNDWYTDAEYTQVFDFANTPVKQDLTLYGQWEINTYAVNFYANGSLYETVPVRHGYTISVPSTNPKREGYIFNGWFKDEDCTIPMEKNEKALGETNYYAGWIKAEMECVYLNGRNGSDENSGVTASDAVATFAKAKELLAKSERKEIRICDQVKVSSEQVWDLSEYPDAVVLRDESYTGGYMFWIDANGKLTLQNIVFDGGAKYWAKDGEDFVGYMVFNCTSGYVTMNAGTEFRNILTSKTSTATVGYLNGAHLTINDGVKIHDNVGGYSGAFGCTSSGASEVVMNGGEIYNNRAIYVATSDSLSSTGSTPAGAFTLAGSSSKGASTLTMNGGRIYNNTVDEACRNGAGAIYLANQANFIMNGGEITGNTGKTAGSILTYGTKTPPNEIQLRGGSIHDNVATTEPGGEIDLRLYVNLVLENQQVLDGSIRLQNNANRLPVQVTKAIEKPLNLVPEKISYRNVLVAGKDYTLTNADMEKINIVGGMDEAFQLTLDPEANNIYVGASVEYGAVIYLGVAGNDYNDGLTPDTAVATFAKAKELLAKNAVADKDNVISVLAGTNDNSLHVTTDQTWSLKGIPNAYLQVAEGTKGYLAYVIGATLTLEDITIDGNGLYNEGKYTTLFRVGKEDDVDKPNGVLNVKSGTVMRNFNDDAIYAYGGDVNVYDGATFTRGIEKTSSCIYATGSYLTSNGRDYTSHIKVYGGNFVDNDTRCFYLVGATELDILGGTFARNQLLSGSGAVIYTSVATTKINIKGGTFQDNALLATSASTCGTVLYTNNATPVTVEGGTFSGNTCASNPMCNGFTSYGSKAGAGMALTLKPWAGMDLSSAPLVWFYGVEEDAITITSALTGNVKLGYVQEAPASGTAVAVGQDYTLTSSDLAKLSCLTEGVTFVLDAANNQITVQ